MRVVKIDVAVGTDVGRVRSHNEDKLLVDEALGLYVVCDGMGGHAAGDVASALACQTIQETVEHAAAGAGEGVALSTEESRRLERVLRNALDNANAAVHELGQRDPDKRGAGTTCTALLVRGGHGFLAHVGDSRAYLRRYSALHQLSTDHTVVHDAIQNGLTREEAEAVFGTNALTRAIGPNEHIVIDTLVFNVLPGDTFLLCSDGLHGYFEDLEELGAVLDDSLETIPETLIARANERGGDDNITAVALRVAAEDAAPPGEVAMNERVREDLAALSHMQLFSEMSYQELLEIASVLRQETFDPDAVVVREGDSSDTLYVIASGKVRVERGGEVVAQLEPGCHFGEIAVLTNRPRTATVRAVGSTRLLALDRPVIGALFERRPFIGMKFLWTLAQVQSQRLDEALLWRAGAPAGSVDEPDAATSRVPAPRSGR